MNTKDQHEPQDDKQAPRDDSSVRGMTQPYTGPESRQGITAHGLEGEHDLRDAKEFAEMIVDTVREGLLVLGLDLRVEAANESFYRLFDVSREATEGHLVYELGNGQWDIPELRELLEEILPENKVMTDYEVEHDFEGIGERMMLLNARQLDEHQKILLAIEDITERRSSMQKLRESEERHRFFVENATEYAIFHLSAEGRITSWNQGGERIFGYEAEEILGRSLAVLFTEADRAAGVPEQEQRTAQETGQASDDRWHVRKDGTRFWATGSMESLPHEDDHLSGFIKILRDNTERKEAEQELRRLNETLEARVKKRTQKVRELASMLTMAEQEERRRISQILHDDLQQVLYGIGMKIGMAQQDAEADEKARLLETLDEADVWLDKAITVARHLTVDLSPPMLKTEGLVDALSWLQTQMEELHGLAVEVEAAHAFHIPDQDMQVLLFQIVRELLFNVVKHAETDHATVVVEDVDEHLVLHVIDQGQGFDVEAAEARREEDGGFGLFSVQERLGLFGGRLEIDSAPGKGTRVTVHTPVEPQWPGASEA